MTSIAERAATGPDTFLTPGGGCMSVIGRDVITPKGEYARVTSVSNCYLWGPQWLCAVNDPFVVLPRVGDRDGGSHGGQYLEVKHLEGQRVRVTLLLPGEGIVEREVSAADIDPRSVPTVERVEGAEGLAEALVQEWRAHRATKEAHKRRMDVLVENAHEYADDNDLCEVFDQFMVRNGLPPRTREYDVRVEISTSVTLRRTARSAEEAEENITSEDIDDALRERGGLYSEDWDIDMTEVAD